MSNITTRQGFAPTTLTEAVQFSEMLASSGDRKSTRLNSSH